uniref:Tc1-like transposase DDE domain-containing protein n=1 Tax=Pseudictyota dubia TaxID=2749911 RepID=A0A7R9ZC58_9STRA|mmetsp:Transcript_38960/g.71978  ORF Transcript_38960/g.71978 Transcript_38960/m.71978 type:complete len:272 (+) Transcript_38960:483-1298(+)
MWLADSSSGNYHDNMNSDNSIFRSRRSAVLASRPGQHAILWTLPYCPDLQPIELFWAAAKNYAAQKYYSGRKVRAMIADLRDGWYGNVYRKDDGTEEIQKGEDDEIGVLEKRGAVNCAALIRHAVKCANERMRYLPGVSGEVGKGLTVDPNYEPNPNARLPIDAFLNVTLDSIEEAFFDPTSGGGGPRRSRNASGALGASDAPAPLVDLGDARVGMEGDGATPDDAEEDLNVEDMFSDGESDEEGWEGGVDVDVFDDCEFDAFRRFHDAWA